MWELSSKITSPRSPDSFKTSLAQVTSSPMLYKSKQSNSPSAIKAVIEMEMEMEMEVEVGWFWRA
jgi:hypothetical protein